ncbi:MAG: hypothetical protein AAF649_07705 [Verrucomicrobiota bacterium]
MNDQELDRLLNQWKTPDTPPWLKTKVMAAVREETDSRQQNRWTLWWSNHTLLRWAMATAVILLAGLLTISVWDQPENFSPEIVSLDEALESFASFSNEEVSSWGEDSF